MGKYIGPTGLLYLWAKVKALVSGKQDTLVSGTNIKTINNESILGSGNITVGGGTSSSVFGYDSTNDAIIVSLAALASYDSTNEKITLY